MKVPMNLLTSILFPDTPDVIIENVTIEDKVLIVSLRSTSDICQLSFCLIAKLKPWQRGCVNTLACRSLAEIAEAPMPKGHDWEFLALFRSQTVSIS